MSMSPFASKEGLSSQAGDLVGSPALIDEAMLSPLGNGLNHV